MDFKKVLSLMVVLLVVISSSIVAAEKYAVLITGEYADDRANFNGNWALANGNDRSAMQEFWNDTYLMWEMLINKGYSNDNIFVLFADGVDFPNSENCPEWLDDRYKSFPNYNIPFITDYSATKENVEMVFNGLATGSNGFPKLNSDDFLVIWTFDHGDRGYVDYESEHANTDPYSCLCLLDYNRDTLISTEPIISDFGNSFITEFEFRDLLNDLNCSKKIVLMQQCFGGGFIPTSCDFYNTIFFTAANDSMSAFRSDALYFDDIDYPGDENPGNEYDAYEWDIWNGHQYKHGEYNLHLINALKGETPCFSNYYETDYADFSLDEADDNNDGVVSIFEAKDWVLDFDSMMRHRLIILADTIHVFSNDDPQWFDQDNIGNNTSIEYPYIYSGNIIENTEWFGDVYISGDVIISGNKTLTIDKDTRIDINENASITVKTGGTINILGTVGHEVVFKAKDKSADIDEKWKGIYLEKGSNMNIQYCVIKDVDGTAVSGNSLNSCVISHLETQNCYSGISLLGTRGYTIEHCTFTGIKNKVEEYNGYGINLNCSDGNIQYNVITNFAKGMNIDSASPNIQLNRIFDNRDCGIFVYGRANPNLGLDKNKAMIEYANNSIYNNGIFENSEYPKTQIYVDKYSYVYLDYAQNNIYSSDVPNTPDMRAYDISHPLIRARYNYWGSSNVTNDFFYPSTGWVDFSEYSLSPFIEYIPHERPEEIILFEEGLQAEQDGDFEIALQKYLQLQTEFPGTKAAFQSLTSLPKLYLATGRNLNDIIEYYNSLKNETWNDDKFMDEMIFRTKLLMEQYLEARAIVETMMANATTDQEIISGEIDLAVIDALESGKGSNNQSVRIAVKKIGNLINKLQGLYISNEENEFLEEQTAVYKITNFPNPFNPTTTIRYTLPHDAYVKLAIYNVNGQVVNVLENTTKTAGDYNVKWTGKDAQGNMVSSGLYFYKVTINNQTIVHKLLLIK